MKKFFTLFFSLIIILSLSGCFLIQTPSERTDPTKPHNFSSELSDKNNSEISLAPFEAVGIYMNNIEKWQIDPDKTRMSMEGYCYDFLDLDFDGVLELITSETQGSGKYSKNSFYRISDDKTSIEIIPFDESVNQKNQCDFIFEDSPVLYKNKSTGNYEYIFCDYIRAGGGMDYFREEEYSYKDGKIYANPLFGYEVIHENVSESGATEEYFTIFNLGESSKVDKETYDKSIKEFESQRINLDLEFEIVTDDEFSEATNIIEQSDMLLDAYEEFSYDGFEFED